MKLNNIGIVLVRTQEPGNAGAACRAMRNTGISELILVSPIDFQAKQNRWMACGSFDLLKNAETAGSLSEALSDKGLTVGFTRRTGSTRGPVITLRESLPEIAAAAEDNKVALVFGNEMNGLSNEELLQCQALVTIPCAPENPSLNLAQAVMVCCYELFSYKKKIPRENRLKLAENRLVEHMYGRLTETLALIGYGNEGDRKVLDCIIRRLRRIFGRSGLEKRDLDTINGMCTQIQNYRNKL
ncbi:MAG: RNA methyltransferase [bacterium]